MIFHTRFLSFERRTFLYHIRHGKVYFYQTRALCQHNIISIMNIYIRFKTLCGRFQNLGNLILKEQFYRKIVCFIYDLTIAKYVYNTT